MGCSVQCIRRGGEGVEDSGEETLADGLADASEDLISHSVCVSEGVLERVRIRGCV